MTPESSRNSITQAKRKMLDAFSYDGIFRVYLHKKSVLLLVLVLVHVVLYVVFESNPTFFREFVWFSIDFRGVTYIIMMGW